MTALPIAISEVGRWTLNVERWAFLFLVFFLPVRLLAAAAPYSNETEAVAAGERLGIGSATIEGPKAAEVMSHGTWTLVYRAGKAGTKPGGGIRIGMRHLVQWSPPQTKNPRAAGYLTVKAPEGVTPKVATGGSRFFRQYFAWQNMVEATLPKQGLEAGQTLRLTYGDRSGGSPGMRVQPFDEKRFVFKVYVDVLGKGEYLPLAESPSIEVVASAPHRLSVAMPSDAVAGEPTWCLVRAEDRYGNPAPRYRGTVYLETGDLRKRLPPRHTFTEADGGVHRFEGIILRRVGSHTVSATDGTLRAKSNPVRVAGQRPKELLLWGDIHGHTLHSDGRGTVEEFYDFAERVAGLDFCAVSDHAFEVLDPMWAHSKAVTNARNRPGRFVTFNAYEWSGNTNVGGDHNLYFLDDDPPLFRSGNYYSPLNLQMHHGPEAPVKHITEVFAAIEKLAAQRRAFCIPHFGGRRGNPRWHHPGAQRLIEIFSEHRRSEDWATTFLVKGHRVGIMASTDGHYGNPGHGYLKPSYQWDRQEIGMASVAVYAAERTRESVFGALYDRRCYATSGDRIILDVRADGHPMGSEFRTATPPTLTIEAIGTAPIARVEIKKNSKIVHTAAPGEPSVTLEWRDPAFGADATSYYYVRILQKDREEAISSPIWVN